MKQQRNFEFFSLDIFLRQKLFGWLTSFQVIIIIIIIINDLTREDNKDIGYSTNLCLFLACL